MTTKTDETSIREQEKQILGRQHVENRQMVIGLLTIITLAFLVLVVRNILIDLNPSILIGLGIATYGIYLGTVILARLALINEA